MNRILITLMVAFATISFSQQNRYWIATSSGLWDDVNNWSTTLNGTPGGGIPKTGENVIFSGSDKGDCQINKDINLNKFETTAGYQGVITFSASTATIGSGNFLHSAGTIDAQSSQIIVVGDMQLSAGFDLNNGELILKGDLLLSNETDFNPGTGKVIISSNQSTLVTNNPQFYTLEITGSDLTSNVVTAIDGLRIYHDLLISPSTGPLQLDGGAYKLGGDFELTNNWVMGDAEIVFNGIGNQYIKGNGIPSISFSKLTIDN